MSDPLATSLVISSAGLQAQSHRLRIVSENIANANTTGDSPEADPYRRKTITFSALVENDSGISSVKIDSLGEDKKPFTLVHDPGHVAADNLGMVKMPNVDILLEMADMRETIRSYEANLQSAKQARRMISMTLDMIGN